MNKNWKKSGISLLLSSLVIFSVIFIARPYWIDARIEKKVDMIELYLEQHYPNDEWVITTVPHREEGYKHLNPYYLGVVFENEQDVTYHYMVENKNNIYQIGHSTNKSLNELKYIETERAME